jgi:hypothetical protein
MTAAERAGSVVLTVAGVLALSTPGGAQSRGYRVVAAPPPAGAPSTGVRPPPPRDAAPSIPVGWESIRAGGAESPGTGGVGLRWVPDARRRALPNGRGRGGYAAPWAAYGYGAYAFFPAWGIAPAYAGAGDGPLLGAASERAERAPAANPLVVPGPGAQALPGVVERYVGATKVIERGAASTRGDTALRVVAIGDTLLRVTWPGDARAVSEVSVFVADSAQRALVRQTMTRAPFTALLPVTADVAYVGVAVKYADGSVTATLRPSGPPRR